MMTVVITLTTAGADSGPFDLYSNVDFYGIPFETGVSKTDLETGYTSTVVPDGTTTIKVKSEGVCTNSVNPLLTVLSFPVSLSYGSTAALACAAASGTVFNL